MGLLGQDSTVGCMQSALLILPHHLQQMKLSSGVTEVDSTALLTCSRSRCAATVRPWACSLAEEGVHSVYGRGFGAWLTHLWLRQAQELQCSLPGSPVSFWLTCRLASARSPSASHTALSPAAAAAAAFSHSTRMMTSCMA